MSEVMINEMLEEVSKWTPLSPSTEAEDTLSSLYDQLSQSQSEIISIKRRINYARKSIDAASHFKNTTHSQKQRLEIINIFKNPVEPESCPLCDQALERKTNPLKELLNLLRRFAQI